MGYTTDFQGAIEVIPPLNADEIAYINKFSDTRRMHRKNGPYFVDGTGFAGQGRDEDIIDHNNSDPEQPGLWCQWIASEDGNYIEWNGAEKFYASAEWMMYLIEHFLGNNPIAKQKEPEKFSFLQGHSLNGKIEAQGEDSNDHWFLIVDENIVSVVDTPNTKDFDGVSIYQINDMQLVLVKIEAAIKAGLPFSVNYTPDEVHISYQESHNEAQDYSFD